VPVNAIRENFVCCQIHFHNHYYQADFLESGDSAVIDEESPQKQIDKSDDD